MPVTPRSTTTLLGGLRRLAVATSCLVLLLPAASSAGAAESTPYGPLSPTNDASVSVSGTVTVTGETLEHVMTLFPPTDGRDYCFTAQKRWTGVPFPANPTSRCGNLGGDSTVTDTFTGLPDTIDVRVCSGAGATLDEGTCSPWTRVFTRAGTPPADAGEEWGPVRAERGLAVAEGKIEGDRITVVLTDRSAQRARCGWAILTVTAGAEQNTSRTRACNERRRTVRAYDGFTAASVKVCSGTKQRPDKGTCRTRRL